MNNKKFIVLDFFFFLPVLVSRLEKVYDEANQESVALNEKLAQLELANIQ